MKRFLALIIVLAVVNAVSEALTMFQSADESEPTENDILARGTTSDVKFVLSLFPFTNNGTSALYQCNKIEANNSIGFSHMSSYLMAMKHFNERDTSVVLELENYRDCPILFNESSTISDTQMLASTSVLALTREVYDHQIPDAVVGGYRELPALDLAVATSGLRIPYIAYGGSNMRVVSPFYYPYSTRLSADANILSERATSFLWHRGRTNYFALLHVRSEAASQLDEGFSHALVRRGITFMSRVYESPRFGGTREDLREGLRTLCETGYKTFILVLEDAIQEIPMIAEAASEFGMLDDGDAVWLFMGNIDLHLLDEDWVIQNPTVLKLLSGATVMQQMDRFMHSPEDDLFLKAWRQQNKTSVDFVNDKNPIKEGHAGYVLAKPNYFQVYDPMIGSGFVYDSVISLGMGLCDARLMRNDDTTLDQVHSVQSVRFKGASGHVQFGENFDYCPGARTSDSLTFGGFNLFPQGDREVSFVLTDIRRGGASSEWTSVAPFYFVDGTEIVPEPLREPGEQNYLSSRVRAFGLSLWGVSSVLSLLACVWVHRNRKHRVIRAYQPVFLHLMVVGAFFMSIPIFLNSFDESYGWTEQQLSRACTSVPWMIIVGHLLVFTSLASKLWRINKVLQFRRRKVTVQQVMWPSAAIICMAMGILVAWTVIDGFEWVRVEIDHITNESIAKCAGEKTELFFTPIFLLIMIPTIFTLIMAIKTRDVDPAFSESKWILTLILVQFQVLLICIPVLRILEEVSTDGKYIGHVMLYFTFSVTPILLIVFPKMVAVRQADVQRMSSRSSKMRGGAGGTIHISGARLQSSGTSRASVLWESSQNIAHDEEGGQRGPLSDERQSSNSVQLVNQHEDAVEQDGSAAANDR